MPRIGLPATPRAAGRDSPGRSSSSPSMFSGLRIASAAIAFRVISSLVASFVTRVFPAPATTALAGSPGASFGLYPMLTRQLGRVAGGVLRAPVTPGLVLSWTAFALAMVMMKLVAGLDTDD